MKGGKQNLDIKLKKKMSVNKVILVGNVGKNPEIRTTQDVKKIAVFPVATSDKWKDRASNSFKEKTEWHRVVVLSEGLVTIIEKYLKKGNRIYIEGMLQTRKWVDSKTNMERFSTEVILQGFNNKLEILERNERKEDESTGSADYEHDFYEGEDYQV